MKIFTKKRMNLGAPLFLMILLFVSAFSAADFIDFPKMNTIDTITLENSGVGQYDSTGNANDVFVMGDIAYLACDNGLLTIDIRNPEDPSKIGEYLSGFNVKDVYVSGDVAYVVVSTGLLSLNVSDPTDISQLDSYSTSGPAISVEVSGNSAFILDTNDGLVAVNITKPQDLSHLSTYSYLTQDNSDMAISGDTLYVLNNTVNEPELNSFNVSDLKNIQLLDQIDLADNPSGIDISGDTAYIACGSRIETINLMNPASLTPLGYIEIGASDIAVAGDIAYATHGSGKMICVDVTDAYSLAEIATYELSSGNAFGISVDGDVAYIAAFSAGLICVGISEPTDPSLLGQITTGIDGPGIFISGDLAYLSNDNGGLVIVDVLNPQYPGKMSDIGIGYPEDVFVAGDVVYLANDTDGVVLIDVQSPLNP